MSLFRTLDSLTDAGRHGVVVIGNFDGVHKGHQAVLRQARELAQKYSDGSHTAPVTVLVFDPHPRQFFAPHAPSLRLTRLVTRDSLLQHYGANHTLALTFDADMAQMSPEDFIDKIIIGALNAKAVCVGHDFHFGKNRTGTTEMLKQYGSENGFDVIVLDAVTPDEQGARPYSSTAIRECLTRGEVRFAAKLLGHAWCLEGEVSKGDQRGRTLNFPTANIALDDYHLPLFGVYAIRTTIKTGAHAGQSYDGVANLGIRPSFETEAPRLEVHLFDFDADIYGETLNVALVDFIRPEQKFAGLEALKAQIAADAETAKKQLALHPALATIPTD
ncbi:MAG: bifunctional riboflavin kinase/FAD synthetase [Parvibaculales bacterium]